MQYRIRRNGSARRMTTPRTAWALAALLGAVCSLCAACATGSRIDSRDSSSNDDNAGGSSANGGGTGGGNTSTSTGNVDPTFGLNDAGTLGSGGGGDGCPPEATLVYVTGVGANLYSFYPPTLTFTLIGTLNCLTFPTHMTVDRQGVAWIESGGAIYKASTKDATCAPLATWTVKDDLPSFALTFVGVEDTIDNTLYLLGGDYASLWKVDVSSGNRTKIKDAVFDVSDFSIQGDMTSDGDGSLFHLLDTDTPILRDVSTMTGSILSEHDLQAKGGGAQALAFWGGSFYAFENNTIYQYDPMTNTTKNIGVAPIPVTGAGQSTCVPKAPPK
jgi:hypothetical protein